MFKKNFGQYRKKFLSDKTGGIFLKVHETFILNSLL